MTARVTHGRLFRYARRLARGTTFGAIADD
jgi:hypothetical protein